MFIVDVTESNVEEYRRSLEGLREGSGQLKYTVRHYPIVCLLAGYRYVFETEDEIDLLIRMIEVDLARFDRKHPWVQRAARQT